MIEPNITMARPKLARLAAVKIPERKRRSGMTGSSARLSAATNATSDTTPTT